MPIHTNSINAILQAYQQGIETSQFRRSEATRQKERTEDIKRQEQQRKEDIARLEKHQQLEDERRAALDAIAKSTQDYQHVSQMQEAFRKTGETQPGYSPIKQESVPISEGVAGTRTTFGPDTSSLNPLQSKPTFSAMDPTSSAMQEAARTRITSEPKQENAVELAQLRTNAQSALKESERQNTMEIAQGKAKNDYEKAIEVQNLKNKGALDVAKIKANKDAINSGKVKLTGTQQKKITSLNAIEGALKEAKDYLENDNWEYFQGPGYGLIGNLMSYKGESNPTWTNIENRLGLARQERANAEEGAAFTSTENQLLKSYLPEPNHQIKSTKAKSDIEYLLKIIPQMRDDIYGTATGVIPTNSSKKSKVDIIQDKINKYSTPK